MRGLLFLLIIVGLGVVLGLQIQADPGYVLITSGDWLIDMPLWLGVTLDVFSVFVLYFLVSLTTYLLRLPAILKQAKQARRMQRAIDETTQGMIAFSEGRWIHAEQLLVAGAQHHPAPLMNYVTAARAAQHLGALERRDAYVRLARENTPNMEVTVGLVEAQLQRDVGQWPQALATLQQVRTLAPEHPYMLMLLREAYVHLHEWERAIRLLPTLVGAKMMTQDAVEIMECGWYYAWLKETVEERLPDRQWLEDFWFRLPWTAQQNSGLMQLYAEVLHRLKAHAAAEEILRKLLKREWSEPAIVLYGKVPGADIAKQLALAESWLERDAQSAMLLLTLGRLCLHNQLWGKAQRYLEASIGLGAQPEAYAELARLLDFLGKKEESKQWYQKGLESMCTLVPFPSSPTILLP